MCALGQVLAAQISPSTYLSDLTDVNDLSFFYFGSELKAAEGQRNILCQPEIPDFKVQPWFVKETKQEALL